MIGIAISRVERLARPLHSLTESKLLLSDLFAPRPAVYWTDFLLTIGIGHLCFALVRLLSANWAVFPSWLPLIGQAAAFIAACLLYYRAAMFIHELAHLPAHTFRAFRFVWNLLCGIPLLMPSFVYQTHIDHHRRRSYGTHEDGEYLALAELSLWHATIYWTQGLYGPLLAVVRFLLLSPLAWVSPPFRRWLHAHASSLVVDPRYVRSEPARATARIILLQEACCFLICLGGLIAVIGFGRWPFPLVLQIYCTAAVVITLNAIRTAAAHRWLGERREMSREEQVLDSVTIDSDGPLAVLLCPLGLRYHALHHLCPSLPYHNLRTAHRRLMAQLPADSPYRRTVEPSVLSALAKLWAGRTGVQTSSQAQAA